MQLGWLIWSIMVLVVSTAFLVLYFKTKSIKTENKVLKEKVNKLTKSLNSIQLELTEKGDAVSANSANIEMSDIKQLRKESDKYHLFKPLETATAIETIIPQKFKDKKILLVEDDDQVRSSFKNILSASFNVYEASDVNTALFLSEHEFPDLIISDIHMPGESGISFCHSLKSNRITSHIPVILVTGRTSEEAHLEGLKAGADAYIYKPFDKNILLTTVNNLLTSIENFKIRFSYDTSIMASDATKNNLDHEFLSYAIRFIEKNISDPGLNGDMLCKATGVSKSLLYIKLKNLTGQTINEFIRTIRLKKSTELLLEGKLNIAQISAELGFNSPSYYTRSFTRHFGLSPTEYIARARN